MAGSRVTLPAWLPAALVAAGLLSIYLPVVGREVSWAPYAGDGGDFLAAAMVGGVPHPGGYPTYTLLLRGALHLPLGTPYLRGALLSALCMALAGGLLCLWIERAVLAGRPLAGACAALASLAWGSAPLVYAHALIVEVHALQALLAAVFLAWYSLVQSGRAGSLRLAAWLSPLLGLGLGNHLTFLLLAPPGGWALRQAFTRGLGRRQLTGLLGLVGLGCLVYLYLPLAARANPPVNWGNPQSWQGVWWVVSGAPYQGLLFQAEPLQAAGRISAWASLLIEQFGLPGLALGAAGLVSAARPLRLLWLYLLLAYSAFAVGYAASDSMVYLIPAYMAWACALALGLNILLNWRPGALAPPWDRFARAALPLALGGLYALFVLVRLPAAAHTANPLTHDGGRAAAYLHLLLTQAPPGALVITNGDQDTFPIWYAHFGLGRRPDLRVLAAPLGQFEWYRQAIASAYPDLILPPAGSPAAGWAEGVVAQNPQRPLCRVAPPVPPAYEVTFSCSP